MSSSLVVVLDTSVWVSGVFFRRGIPARILRAWRDRHFEIVVTSETLAELERKLEEKMAEFERDTSSPVITICRCWVSIKMSRCCRQESLPNCWESSRPSLPLVIPEFV